LDVVCYDPTGKALIYLEMQNIVKIILPKAVIHQSMWPVQIRNYEIATAEIDLTFFGPPGQK